MRDLDQLKKASVFQHSLIRVQFPDKALLQANFHPRESVSAGAHICLSVCGMSCMFKDVVCV